MIERVMTAGRSVDGDVGMARGKGGDGALYLPAFVAVELSHRKGGCPTVGKSLRLKACVVQLVYKRGCLASKELACRRYGKAAPLACQKVKAELGFQGLDLLRYG